MIRVASICIWLTGWAVPTLAQELNVSSSAMGLRFHEPSRVGLDSYSQQSTAVSVRFPVLDWLAVGGKMQYASATVSSRLNRRMSIGGLTDTELFSTVRVGPVHLRGGYFLDSGVLPSSSQSVAVAGVTAYEFFPVPVRSWGGGGGYGVDTGLRLGTAGVTFEVFAALRSHGTVNRPNAQGLEYEMGGERELGFQATFRPSILTRVATGVRISSADPDDVVALGELGRTEFPAVFDPGPRFGAHFVVELPMERTSVRLVSNYSRRGYGNSQGVLTDATGRRTTDTPPRHVIAGAVETRTPFRYLPLRASLRVRGASHANQSARGWLSTVGIGTDLSLFGPWPGRLLVVSTAGVHWGRIRVAEGYESAASGWGLSISAALQGDR